MSEKLTSRSRDIVAASLAGLAFGAGAGASEARAAASVPAPPISNPNILAAGGNIAQARIILSPKRYKDSTSHLIPDSQIDTEDLAVIYDEKFSRKFIAIRGEPMAGDSVGAIVESNLGSTAIKLVFFQTLSGRIDLVTSPAMPIDHKRSLFNYVDPAGDTSQNYRAYIAPQTNTHGPVVSFKHTGA